MNWEVTFVAAVLGSVLQTRAPTGKSFGPTLSSLLSSPIVFHVIVDPGRELGFKPELEP